VDDGGTGLLEFGLGDPKSLEGRQGGKDGTTDPDGESSLGGGDDSDLDGGGGKSGDFLLESLSNTVEHGGTTGHNDVTVKLLSDIDIALHDGLEGELVVAGVFLTELVGLEEGLGASELLVAEGDGLTIGKLVVDLLDGGVAGSLQLGVEVLSNVAVLLLDVSGDFSLSGGGEVAADLSQKLDHVVSQISTGKIDSHDGVGKGVTLIDGDGVGDTITGIQDDTSGSAGGVEGKDGLDVDVEVGDGEVLEEDLDHLLSVGLGVHGSLSQESIVLFGVDSELIEIAVMPDLLHIVPRGDNTVLDGVRELQDTSLGLSLLTDIDILLLGTNHDLTASLGSADNGGEDATGGILTSNTGLTHTGTIINNDSG